MNLRGDWLRSRETARFELPERGDAAMPIL